MNKAEKLKILSKLEELTMDNILKLDIFPTKNAVYSFLYRNNIQIKIVNKSKFDSLKQSKINFACIMYQKYGIRYVNKLLQQKYGTGFTIPYLKQILQKEEY